MSTDNRTAYAEVCLFEGIPIFRNGDVLPKEGAFMLTLQPAADIVLPIQPKETRDATGLS